MDELKIEVEEAIKVSWLKCKRKYMEDGIKFEKKAESLMFDTFSQGFWAGIEWEWEKICQEIEENEVANQEDKD